MITQFLTISHSNTMNINDFTTKLINKALLWYSYKIENIKRPFPIGFYVDGNKPFSKGMLKFVCHSNANKYLVHKLIVMDYYRADKFKDKVISDKEVEAFMRLEMDDDNFEDLIKHSYTAEGLRMHLGNVKDQYHMMYTVKFHDNYKYADRHLTNYNVKYDIYSK